MTDLASVARQARAALADARDAVLLVDGLGTCGRGDAAVVLHERDGHPTLICDPGSRVSVAARSARQAMLSVETCGQGTVVFVGTLVLDGIEHVDGVEVDVIGLRLRSVVVETEDGTGPVIARELPLEVYLGSSPDVLGQYAARLLVHTNAVHAADLRVFVARRLTLPVASIAAARLTLLDERGAHLEWVDATGGHMLHLPFARPAVTAAQLSAALRDHLAG